MQNKYYALYDALKEGIKNAEPQTSVSSSSAWVAVETRSNAGIAMNTEGMYRESLEHAAINAYYNRTGKYYEPYENYCTAGLNFSGKTVGVVGHLGEVVRRHGNEAKKIMIFELNPREGDFPAEKEDELLPECDIVIITGSSLINRTLPHLLEITENAYKILTGPSVPMFPALLDFGINRIAGMSVNDIPAMRKHISENRGGSPYGFGTPFLIK